MNKFLGVSLVTLWFQVAWVNSQQREENLQVLSIQEGEDVTVNCSYKAYTTALQWYKQESGRGPAMLVLIRSNEREKLHGRLRATLDTSTQSSSLSITAARAADSGAYFCATDKSGGNNKLMFGKGTTLSVIPDIEDPKPAVYQMRDTQSKDTICLFTDFDSQISVSSSTSPDVFISNKTVLNMKSMDSKSNGAIAWSNQADLNCRDAFKENTSYPSEDVPCDAKLIEKSFETDMNLNFQNLSVMGLRILLLKVAGFNLLMTLRLWSS